jgi:hypothetical protein
VWLKGDFSAVSLELNATGSMDWKLLEDGRLAETITKFEVVGSKINGRPTAPGFLATLVGEDPGSFGQELVNKPSSPSPVQFKDGNMIVSGDRTTTTCKR